MFSYGQSISEIIFYFQFNSHVCFNIFHAENPGSHWKICNFSHLLNKFQITLPQIRDYPKRVIYPLIESHWYTLYTCTTTFRKIQKIWKSFCLDPDFMGVRRIIWTSWILHAKFDVTGKIGSHDIGFNLIYGYRVD